MVNFLQVAQEKQQQLLRELEAEDRAAADRDAKKAKDAQKKKDKKKSVLSCFCCCKLTYLVSTQSSERKARS